MQKIVGHFLRIHFLHFKQASDYIKVWIKLAFIWI